MFESGVFDVRDDREAFEAERAEADHTMVDEELPTLRPPPMVRGLEAEALAFPPPPALASLSDVRDRLTSSLYPSND